VFDYIIFRVKGGLGKNVLSTAVCETIKNNYKESNLIVISAHPEVFINNPNVYRVYSEQKVPYFYDDFIKNKKVKIINIDPYEDEGYLLEKEHLIETWCKVGGLIYSKELPKLYLTSREISFYKNQALSTVTKNKPILLIHPFGGRIDQGFKYNWNRDLPVTQAQELVDVFLKEYHVIQVGSDGQVALSNVPIFSGSNRELFSLVSLSNKNIFIDSSCQHIAAALNKKSTVCWITNKPKVFGYEIHDNILAKSYSTHIHYIDSLFQKENWTGEFNNYYPYPDDQVFDINEIVESVYKN